MIFISSNCSKKNNIKEVVQELVDHGIKDIELSGGTNFYPSYLDDLIELKAKHNLNYRLHNYFPPPEKHFVLNLASANESVLEQSRDMVMKSAEISKLFGSTKYGIHAGFRISPRVDELGKKISNTSLLPYEEALEKFSKEMNQLISYSAGKNVQLYLENNVFSKANSESFNNENPFFLTNSKEYFEMKKKINFSLLLDVAHLKVSCQTLGLNFADEFRTLIKESDYIHISNNDGSSDSNNELAHSSDVYQLLKEADLKGKTFTVEVYDGVDAVSRTVEVIRGLI